jgi:hypothetical protein
MELKENRIMSVGSGKQVHLFIEDDGTVIGV